MDLYGISYTLKTKGKDKYKSSLGGCLTIVSFIVISLISFFFGTDFLYKKNPNVRQNEIVHEERQEIDLAQDTHPFMIRLQKQETIKEGVLKLNTRYHDYKVSDDGRNIENCYVSDAVTNCALTSLKKAPQFLDEDLSAWYCIDFEKVTRLCKEKTGNASYKPIMGGTSGDGRIGSIYLGVANWDFGPNFEFKNITPNEEFKNITEFIIDIRYPKYFFNSELKDNALIQNTEIETFPLHKSTSRFEYRYMKIVTLNDDLGWVNEQITPSHSIDLDATVVNYRNHDYSQEGAKGFYSAIFYLNKKEKVFNRRFMRLQDVVAQVSGFAKAFVTFTIFFYCIYLVQKRSRTLINDLFEVDQEKAASVHQEIADGTIVSVMVEEAKVATSKDNRVEKVGFFSFLYEYFQKRRDQLRNDKFFNAAEKFIDEQMDVLSILHLYEKVERLRELTLSEEDRQLLEMNRKRATLLN